ncbi:glycosyltransferase [uncultured Erythrobacter sp.]|uniref:glycosyltransferase n=1 Tax=uncultured Erythrobacter sp. TaxID=263913 RepID=UPI0026597953|nr:glycosyltransferase [uncultured Erythrobacter sp.]
MKLAILFDNFGPYHMARLNALANYCTLVGIEFHSKSAEYSWKTTERASFEHRTLLNAGHVPPGTLSEAVHAALTDVAPDVVFIPGWNHIGALAALVWCRNMGRPAVIMSDSQERDTPRTWLKEHIKARVLRHASACFVAGRRHRDYAQTLGVPVEYIRTGYDVIDNDYFKCEAEVLRRSPSLSPLRAGYFLASARLIPRKNIGKLIEGYGRYREQTLQRKVEPKDLVILGDGPERANLEAQINDCGLSEVVHFKGFLQYPDLPRYYAYATAFIHVPLSEQWGLVVNEALACGLPVIVSSACGCAPDLVFDEQNGFVVQGEDTERMAECLIKIDQCSASELDDMRDASFRSIERFSVQSFSDNAIAIASLAISATRRRATWFDDLVLLFMYAMRKR